MKDNKMYIIFGVYTKYIYFTWYTSLNFGCFAYNLNKSARN